jgi:hypothetical protein
MPNNAYEQDWYERLKLIADRVHERKHKPTALRPAPTIMEETAADDEVELVAGR